MATRWRISYQLTHPAQVVSPVSSYPDISVSLRYDDKGQLVGLDHELDANDDELEGAVRSRSQVALAFWWEVMQFQRKVPLFVGSTFAVSLGPTSNCVASASSEHSFIAGGSLAKKIVMPRAEAFSGSDQRQLVLFKLANMADRSADPADAIRLYSIIWEDLHGRRKYDQFSNPLMPEEKLQILRDFVSHAKVDNDGIKNYIKEQLQKPVNQYDPLDVEQAEMVKTHRAAAAELIHAEMLQRFPWLKP